MLISFFYFFLTHPPLPSSHYSSPIPICHIVAALERYYAFKQSPEMVKTQRVRASAIARESKLGQSILDKLKSITTRLTTPFRG